MLLTNDNIDFKKVNRNLKQELSKMGFEISNQSCLNLLSRALGYKNYNTYSALESAMPSQSIGTELENIFHILKNMTLDDFSILSGYELQFVYKKDTNLTITEDEYEEKENAYGYDFFFDRNGNEIELTLPYDRLVKKICQYKDFPETYNTIKIDRWTIRYNNVEVYYINTLTISNLSSLHVTLPLEIKTFDFIYNLCKMSNNYSAATFTTFAVNDILETLNIQDSTFDDFLKYR